MHLTALSFSDLEPVSYINLLADGVVGQKRFANGADTDYFYLKDHLGSTRLVLKKKENGTAEVASASDYYPFGLQLREVDYTALANDVKKYKFTGKERDAETGLDYFGARYYDSYVGRWFGVDPLADKYAGLSPYNYVGNNPLGFYDPNGMIIGDGKELVEDYKEHVDEKIARYQNELAKLNKGQTKKADELNTKIVDLNAALAEVAVLESKDNPQVYNVYNSESPDGNNYKTVYDPKTNAVNIHAKTSSGGMTKLGHELKHAFQFEVGKLSFSGASGGLGGGRLYDLMDEFEAYQREGSLGGFAKSLKSLEGDSDYAQIKNRTTQRTLNSPYELSNYKTNFINANAIALKRRGFPIEYFIGWQDAKSK